MFPLIVLSAVSVVCCSRKVSDIPIVIGCIVHRARGGRSGAGASSGAAGVCTVHCEVVEVEVLRGVSRVTGQRDGVLARVEALGKVLQGFSRSKSSRRNTRSIPRAST